MHHLFANELVARAGGGEDVTGAAEPRIHAVPNAELLKAADALGDLARGLHGAFGAVQLDQAVELVPPSAREAPVAAARTAAANVLLQHRDAEVRVPLHKPVGGPESRESATDDDDVGGPVGRKWRTRCSVFGGQRLAQPPAALRAGRQRRARQVEQISRASLLAQVASH